MSEPLTQPFSLLLTHDDKQTPIGARTPFTIGRSPEMDLVLPYPYISRRHAEIVTDPATGALHLVDLGSQSGCFVNGLRITRHPLSPGDQIRLGSVQGPLLRLSAKPESTSSLRSALDRIKEPSGADADLGKLTWFVEAARRLNNVGAVQEILAALIDTTLQLTRVERGYVFLCGPGGRLQLAAGRSLAGEALEDDSTVSHSAIQQAIDSGSEFISTDTLSAEASTPSHSMLVQSIRALICIPLRKRPAGPAASGDVLGVLYLDSRKQRNRLTRLDNDLLSTIATEAALLVENASLAQSELAARRYHEELLIAFEIQQSLMSVQIPDLPFAQVDALNVPCTGIGGDFYDVLTHNDALYLVIADISGKGVAAAVLGSTLQGLIHAQILAGVPLPQIARFTNQYICSKNIRKYATLVLLRLLPDGSVEYLNCGQVQPVLHTPGPASDAPPSAIAAASRTPTGETRALRNCNLPVGLLADAVYVSEQLQLEPGQRVILITDGATEAENPIGEPFGDQRLHSLVQAGATLPHLLSVIRNFTAGAPLEDDCTLVEVQYLNFPGAPLG